MKTILLSAALFLYSTPESSVFICVSKSTEVYHYKKDCQGIKRCKHEVKEVSLAHAKEMGLRMCRYEN